MPSAMLIMLKTGTYYLYLVALQRVTGNSINEGGGILKSQNILKDSMMFQFPDELVD